MQRDLLGERMPFPSWGAGGGRGSSWVSRACVAAARPQRAREGRLPAHGEPSPPLGWKARARDSGRCNWSPRVCKEHGRQGPGRDQRPRLEQRGRGPRRGSDSVLLRFGVRVAGEARGWGTELRNLVVPGRKLPEQS